MAERIVSAGAIPAHRPEAGAQAEGVAAGIATLAAAVENGMVVGAADAFEQQHGSIPEAAHQHALAAASASVTFGGDLGTELFEADEELDAAIAQGDAALIGHIVLAVRQALVETLAARALEGRCRTATAKQAAMAVLMVRRAAS